MQLTAQQLHLEIQCKGRFPISPSRRLLSVCPLHPLHKDLCPLVPSPEFDILPVPQAHPSLSRPPCCGFLPCSEHGASLAPQPLHFPCTRSFTQLPLMKTQLCCCWHGIAQTLSAPARCPVLTSHTVAVAWRPRPSGSALRSSPCSL